MNSTYETLRDEATAFLVAARAEYDRSRDALPREAQGRNAQMALEAALRATTAKYEAARITANQMFRKARAAA